MVAESLVPALQDVVKQETLKKRLGERKLDRLFTFIERVVIDGHSQDVIPYDVMEGTTRHLMSLIEYIKSATKRRGASDDIPSFSEFGKIFFERVPAHV